jgi:ABC-type lipoprotein export system ATPase subunit
LIICPVRDGLKNGARCPDYGEIGSLDSVTANEVMAVFEKLVEQGKTLVMVTHDKDFAQRANRTIVLVDGEVKG